MFGTNVVSGPNLSPVGDLLVNDLVYTIQGEGPDAGRPAIFLRLAKCNQRCYFCDTEFENVNHPGTIDLLVNEIGELSAAHRCNLVVITGGEPLLQNVVPLIQRLNALRISVSIETAGTVYVEGLDKLFHRNRSASPRENLIVISPKTPKLNFEVAQIAGALKYIINSGEVDHDDGLPNMSTQVRGQFMKLFRPISGVMSGIPIYVQAQDTGDEHSTHRNVLLAATLVMRHGYRLSVQLHKIAQLP